MLFLFDLIVESFDFCLMQVLELIFVLSVLPDKVILDIFILSFDKIDFVSFLLFELLEFVFAVGRLNETKLTSDLSS